MRVAALAEMEGVAVVADLAALEEVVVVMDLEEVVAVMDPEEVVAAAPTLMGLEEVAVARVLVVAPAEAPLQIFQTPTTMVQMPTNLMTRRRLV
jgi:hypothetical protein